VSDAPIKLLVVDDDDAGRYLKMRTLRRHGYHVLEADCGRLAIELASTEAVDLVVLDTRLLDMDGGEVCRQVKAAAPHVAVLQTSAAIGSAQDRARALDGGADAFLVEPIEPEEFLATIKALLRMRRAEQALRRVNENLEDLVAERTRELTDANRRLEIESEERRKAEEALWHAQKLEAVGQLTGGIAHDFNNLLSVIVSSLEMIRAAVEGKRQYAPGRLLRLIGAAEVAADRSAKLTQQLLAFARRSVLSSETVVVSELLAASEGFLRRALGDAISLELVGEPALWPCRIDPVQFEAAIVNLAVNGRDAMPGGGQMTITTRNVEIGDDAARALDAPAPGQYVQIEVADTGFGMSPEIAQRAFEPFFTTKDVGKGTGLGLSQVYGFVTQSGGHVAITSEVGRGATVTIRLPRSAALPEPVGLPHDGDADVPMGRETILVVEDNVEVHELVVMTLNDLGYRVLSATSGPAALDIVRSGKPVDLLFSDVMMPGGMNGFELVRAAQSLRPGLKALVTSGYAGVPHQPDSPAAPILVKPYGRSTLAQRLRIALDAVA
jgi:signal transduction histidine kinase